MGAPTDRTGDSEPSSTDPTYLDPDLIPIDPEQLGQAERSLYQAILIAWNEYASSPTDDSLLTAAATVRAALGGLPPDSPVASFALVMSFAAAGQYRARGDEQRFHDRLEDAYVLSAVRPWSPTFVGRLAQVITVASADLHAAGRLDARSVQAPRLSDEERARLLAYVNMHNRAVDRHVSDSLIEACEAGLRFVELVEPGVDPTALATVIQLFCPAFGALWEYSEHRAQTAPLYLAFEDRLRALGAYSPHATIFDDGIEQLLSSCATQVAAWTVLNDLAAEPQRKKRWWQ